MSVVLGFDIMQCYGLIFRKCGKEVVKFAAVMCGSSGQESEDSLKNLEDQERRLVLKGKDFNI